MDKHRIYLLGYRHGLAGVRYMAHRQCRPYERRSDTNMYIAGYKKGHLERLANGGSVTLDYSNPLNKQWFG